MKKRKVSNLLALAILALLSERPMHPYEISAIMKQRGLSDSIKLNYGSLYSVIDVLLRENWIVPQETQREGKHPERTIYAITKNGKQELIEWLRTLLRYPATEYTQFAAGLSFLAHLSPDEATTLLEERVQMLQQNSKNKREEIKHSIEQIHIDRLFLIEDEYVLFQMESELAWVQQIIKEIKDEILTERIDNKLHWRVRNLDAEFQTFGNNG